MRPYTQLTREARYQIYALLHTQQTHTTIATLLGVHKSTISRELRRNRAPWGYRPFHAHCSTLRRRRGKAKGRIAPATWRTIDTQLEQDKLGSDSIKMALQDKLSEENQDARFRN